MTKNLRFIFQTAAKNILKNKLKSVLTLLTAAPVVLLLNLYMGNIGSLQSQLAELAASLTIRADVINLNGSQTIPLKISDEKLNQLENSIYVQDFQYSVELKGGLGEFSIDDWREHLTLFLSAVSELSALPGLTAENITYADGMDASIFSTDKPLCLVTQRFANENNLRAGDTFPITLYYYDYPSTGRSPLNIYPLGLYNLQVSGIIGQLTGGGTDIVPPDIVLPIAWVKNAYAESGIDFFATKASFAITDPLKLNEFKKEAATFLLMSVIPQADFSYTASALSIFDKTFIQAADNLQGNLTLLHIFFPIILAIVIFIGYIASYLLMQSRRREFAVMRSLGTTKKICYLVFIIENAALALIGGTVGSFISVALVGGASATVPIAATGLFFVCYLLGTAVALHLLGRFSVMDVLSQID